MPTPNPHVAALTISATEQAHLLDVIDAHLAANPALHPVLFPVRGEIADLCADTPGMLLPSGGVGLRLLYDLLIAGAGDMALAARIHKELSPGSESLADGALVTIIFDAKR